MLLNFAIPKNMADDEHIRAWNNFISLSDWEHHEAGSSKRAAAIASLFMGLANNGGFNAFLSYSYDLDSQEVLDALNVVGALQAASHLDTVLRALAVALPVMSQEQRAALLDEYWTEDLDDRIGFDVLTSEADDELMAVLARHVQDHQAFYLALGDWRPLEELGAAAPPTDPPP